MKKYVAAVLVALVLCFAVVGCGGESIKSGKVVAKEYIAPYDSTWFMMVGKVMMPMTEYHDAEWVLKLEACEEGKCKTGHVSVSQSDYETENIGETWISQE